MKKLIVLLAIAWFGLANVNDQKFKIGTSLVVPLADGATWGNFSIGFLFQF